MQGAKLYVLVDSAEVQTQSFVETLDDAFKRVLLLIVLNIM